MLVCVYTNTHTYTHIGVFMTHNNIYTYVFRYYWETQTTLKTPP